MMLYNWYGRRCTIKKPAVLRFGGSRGFAPVRLPVQEYHNGERMRTCKAVFYRPGDLCTQELRKFWHYGYVYCFPVRKNLWRTGTGKLQIWQYYGESKTPIKGTAYPVLVEEVTDQRTRPTERKSIKYTAPQLDEQPTESEQQESELDEQSERLFAEMIDEVWTAELPDF